MREYKSGTTWCFWRWTVTDSKYITRLHLIKTPWFAICLHWILKPDPEPYLHDHPVSFLSIILRGWYREMRHTAVAPFELVMRRWFNWIRAARHDRHTICSVAPRGALTLCLMGPKRQEWGFHDVVLRNGVPTTHLGAWLHWRDYHHAQRALAAAAAASCECSVPTHAPFCPARTATHEQQKGGHL